MTNRADPPFTPILDHVRIPVRDCELSRRFYDAALAPLGLQRISDVALESGDAASGYGREGEPAAFWFSSTGVSRGFSRVGFRADSRDAVRAFHRAALAAGGRDHRPPAVYPTRHPRYFAACVYDPDGYGIEAVTHAPEDEVSA
jgi:catechol 2,3-dioxygenase-like lactoylglutathione lyase family enzyme